MQLLKLIQVFAPAHRGFKIGIKDIEYLTRNLLLQASLKHA